MITSIQRSTASNAPAERYPVCSTLRQHEKKGNRSIQKSECGKGVGLQCVYLSPSMKIKSDAAAVTDSFTAFTQFCSCSIVTKPFERIFTNLVFVC
mmetsp:Transcript_114742/g.199582  ORF Transcript_114742/g.199582 Transcript_114742/m.199582 type:complete len:96 (+) Transcript_114742:1153-1440(+)